MIKALILLLITIKTKKKNKTQQNIHLITMMIPYLSQENLKTQLKNILLAH